MIEKVIYGILTLAFGLGAYLSGRKMSRGQVYYYGKTLPKRPARNHQDDEGSAEEDIDAARALAKIAKLMVLAAELEEEFSSPELARDFALVLKEEYPTDRILARLEARAQARKTRERMKKTSQEPVEAEQWKDDIESRLRALEEKSADEERLAFAVENPKAPNTEQIN